MSDLGYLLAKKPWDRKTITASSSGDNTLHTPASGHETVLKSVWGQNQSGGDMTVILKAGGTAIEPPIVLVDKQTFQISEGLEFLRHLGEDNVLELNLSGAGTVETRFVYYEEEL